MAVHNVYGKNRPVAIMKKAAPVRKKDSSFEEQLHAIATDTLSKLSPEQSARFSKIMNGRREALPAATQKALNDAKVQIVTKDLRKHVEKFETGKPHRARSK